MGLIAPSCAPFHATMTTGIFSGIQWPNLVAGLAGGVVSSAILHPLDLAKVRLQVNEGTGVVPCR